MKRDLMLFGFTAVYIFGAVFTYHQDRVLGNAKCWQLSLNNTPVSSVLTAITWPFYAVLVGTVIVMGADVGPFACGNKAEQKVQ